MSDSSSSASSSSGVSAQQIFEAMITDPRKSLAGGAGSASNTPFVPIDVPRGDDGKYLYCSTWLSSLPMVAVLDSGGHGEVIVQLLKASAWELSKKKRKTKQQH